jgi:GAF domain-containing protein
MEADGRDRELDWAYPALRTPAEAIAGDGQPGDLPRDRAQLYAGFRQIAGEQAALRRVAMLVAQAPPPEAVFAAVAAEAGRLLGADVALSVRYDPRDSITVLGAWTSSGAAAPLPLGSQLPLGGHNATTLVFRTGQTARVDHADMSGVIGDLAAQGGRRRASVGVPIRVEDRLWGAMTSEELLPADAEARLAGFTELVATAIANAQRGWSCRAPPTSRRRCGG